MLGDNEAAPAATKKLSAEDEEAVNASMQKLTAEATSAVQAGRFDVAESILAKAGHAVASVVGTDCTQYISLQVMLATILHAAGSFERCVEVAGVVLPVIERVHGRDSDATAICLLRLGAAEIGSGKVEDAALTLEACSEIIEVLHEEGTGGAAQIVPEAAFYTALVALYGSSTITEIKSVENTLLQATSAMREVLGRDNGLCTAAIRAHSKLLFHSIEAGDREELSRELFAQLLLLHRAMQYSESDLSLVQYQRGTWLYTTGAHQLARDVVEESLEMLVSNPPSEADLAEDGSLAQGYEHEMMLRKLRIAVIDCVMIHSGEASDEGTAQRAHATLSELSAHYAELLDADNALSAEARFALALLGLAEKLDAEAGAAKEMDANMVAALKVMARALPRGLNHMLVQKLLPMYEARFGALKLTPEEEQQLRQQEEVDDERAAGAAGAEGAGAEEAAK